VFSVFSVLFLRIAAALVGTGVAAWQDARTSFIDDRITLSMIAAGAVLCAFEAFEAFQAGADLTPWFWVAAIAIAIGVFGFFAWRAGQFGGGDVLLFLGLELLLPFNPVAPLPYPFVVSVLVTASFFGAVWSAAWYAKRLRDESALSVGKNVAALFGVAACVTLFAWLSFSFLQTVFFTALFAAALFLSLYKKEIMSAVVVKMIPLNAVEDEDVLAVDELPKRLLAKYSFERVLTKAAVARLRGVGRKEKIRLWPVAKELPRFAPFVLAGLAACLLVGDVIYFVLTH